MHAIFKAGLLALAIMVALLALTTAPAAAAFTCGATSSPCASTLTVADSRSGSSTLVTAGGLGIIRCSDSTISLNLTDEAASISTTGASVTFTTCRFNIDAGCTVTITPLAADAWTVTLTSSTPLQGPTWAITMVIGEVRIVFTTCNIASNNGTITLTRGSRLGAMHYTSSTGAMTADRTAIPYTVTGNLRTILGASGTASFTSWWTFVIDSTRRLVTVS